MIRRTIAADAYVEDLNKLLELIERYPRMARLRPEFRPRIRAHLFHAHVVLYRQVSGGIEVLRVLGRGQDWQRHLEEL